LKLEDQGYLKVYFADESGFCLDPTVPYGWQPCGQYTAIVPQKSKRRNVFGLLSRDNEFEGYDTFSSMNAELLVAFIDDFATRIKQKSVIIIDNAPFHHANIVKDKIAQWAEQDLLVWFLPKYSPHLNKIETLWRKIKYEWLKPQDYSDWNTFNDALDNIFKNMGSKFSIDFAPNLSVI
jgi:transposase